MPENSQPEKPWGLILAAGRRSRLAAVVGADRIYVLEDGRVAEAGTHGELLEHGGPYARLWSRQAEL